MKAIPGIHAHLLRLCIASLLVGAYLYANDRMDREERAGAKPRVLVFRKMYLNPEIRKRNSIPDNFRINQVILAGPFSSWNTQDRRFLMTRKNDSWRFGMRFPPGETQYKFVIHLHNRKKVVWIADPHSDGLRDDGFGGNNSVVIIRNYEGTRLVLQLLLLGCAGILILYSISALLFHWFFSSRLTRTSRLLLVFLFVFLLSNAGILWFNLRQQRALVRDCVGESAGIFHAALQGLGVDFDRLRSDVTPDDLKKLENASTAVFAMVRTRTGSSVFSRLDSSIHRIVIFDRDFRIIHIADRREFPLGPSFRTIRNRLLRFYRERVFHSLVLRAKRNLPSAFFGRFGDPDRGEVSPEFDRDSSLLGFNIALVPALTQGKPAVWYGIVLFPGAYAERIGKTLLINVGWSLFLLIFSLLFFVFRPKTRALSDEALTAYADRYHLTQREREVVTFLARGTDYRTIADTLFISLKTVKAHVYNIYQKSDVSNRLELFERIRKSV